MVEALWLMNNTLLLESFYPFNPYGVFLWWVKLSGIRVISISRSVGGKGLYFAMYWSQYYYFLPLVLYTVDHHFKWTFIVNITFLQTRVAMVFAAFYNLWQLLMRYHHWAFPKKFLWNLQRVVREPFLQKLVPLYWEYQQFTKSLGSSRKSFLKLHRILQDLPASESSVFICYQVWIECHESLIDALLWQNVLG